MLKNIKTSEVTVKYNGLEKTVSPNGSLDVRDFGVAMGQVIAVQNRMLKKYPGSFEATSDFGAAESAEQKELIERIKILEKENASLKESITTANEAKEAAEERMRGVQEENQGLKDDLKESKKSITELKAKLKAAQ